MPEAKIPIDLGYKEYKALLTQESTGSPVPIIQNANDNCFLEGVGFDYVDVGIYKAVSSGLFTEGKTFLPIQYACADGDRTNRVTYVWISESEIRIYADAEGTSTDGIMTNTPFWIQVFP